MEDKDKFIIFLHIQKTAGSTVQKMFLDHYGPGFARRAVRKLQNSSPEGLALKKAMSQKQFRDRYFMGHFCFGAHRYLPQPSVYITFLRDPLARLISLYYYSKGEPRAFYHESASRHTLESFLCQCDLPELDNGMTRFLAGSEEDLFINWTANGAVDEKLYEQAIQNLEQHFIFAGIVERFDESILLLAHQLGWGTPYYFRLNENREKPRQPGITPDALEQIKARNAWDFRLYENCTQQFDAELQRAFPNLENTLADFRKQNQIRQQRWFPLYKTSAALKSRLKSWT